MCATRLYIVAVLYGLAATGVIGGVGAMRVYTSGEVNAVNGTDVRLKCTFQSSSPINPSTLTVSWSFRPLSPGREESVFYFHDRPYPPPDGRFRKRAVWDGDVTGRDASIVLREVKFTYNGTYVCQVKNPPDVHGNAGEVRLSVLTTASFSEIVLLAAAIGGGIVVVVILLVVVMSCRQCKKKKRLRGAEEGVREAPPKEKKDPTVCHPLEAIHLYASKEEMEIDSSDGMISYPSTKDPSSSEEEDDDSGDEGGGGGDSD